MVKEFVFKNAATIYANDLDEAKNFIRENFEINDNAKNMRKLLVFTNEDVDSIYEVNCDREVTETKVPSIGWWNR